jgi:hypothetical protein
MFVGAPGDLMQLLPLDHDVSFNSWVVHFPPYLPIESSIRPLAIWMPSLLWYAARNQSAAYVES